MKKVFYLLVIALFASACSLQEQEIPDETLPIANSEGVNTVPIVSLGAYGIRKPTGVLKYGKELYIGDRKNSDNIYRVDLSHNTKEGFQPRVRTRSGGAIMLNSLASDGKQGWTAFDCHNKRMIYAPSAKTRSGEENMLFLPKDQLHLWAVQAGEYILATGIYSEGRYMLYSPVDGRTIYSGDYPEHPSYPDIQQQTKALLFASNVLRVRPDGQAFVCADMYSGVLELCRINDEGVSLIKRLVYHYPRVRISERKKWPEVIYSRRNHFGFTDVCVTDKCIYALYSGRTYGEDNMTYQHCRTLIEIAWDGTVLHTYPLDSDLTHITYDTETKSLYGIAYRPEMTLVKIALP